ncbi:hypothetical protein CASFOL_000564 [Castilleja foliolosa]|uniref:Non-haem dioxygenase N-terminal domain-containing protein n=1 Tax=Castilleja foliolosa TaxID=1961234 RepID=A0ABD3CWA3_9LAMI
MPPKIRPTFSSLPSPIPTGGGSRSAADPILTERIYASVRIPELTLPDQHAHRLKPEEINYRSLVSRENESVRRLVRSIREFGAVQIRNHGIILTEELSFALDNGDRLLGCGSYGDHEKIVWRGGDDRRIMKEATAAIGERRNYNIFRSSTLLKISEEYELLNSSSQNIENVKRQLRAIAKELAEVIAQTSSYGKQIKEPIELGESILSIYRHHRANTIDRTSSLFINTSQDQSGPYALSLHLLLESTEFCVESSCGKSSFSTSSDTIYVTIGKELEEKSCGELKSGEYKLKFKPCVHTKGPSFSIEQKWYMGKVGKFNKTVLLADQILILLVLALLYNFFSYMYSWA